MTDYPLSSEHKKLIDELQQQMQADIAVRERICTWMKQKFGSELTDHFDELSEETKLDACLDHIAIALVSGDVSTDEIKKLL